MTNLSGTNLNRREATGPKGEGRDSPSNFPKYPEYKDSGVEWLGEVPVHWEVAPISSKFELRNGYPFKAELFTPEGATSDRLIRIRDILKDESRIFTPESCPSWAKVKDGDVLIGMDGDFNVAYWDKGLAKLNQRVCALRGESVAWDKFLFYGITQPLSIINDLTFSTTVKHLSSNQVLKTRFPLPPESETNNIVAFLDHETAQIDVLVNEQQRLIELLKEKRQAVISHAVTKGLDPDVPMKDSGVEWLGEVPGHWTVERLKDIVKDGTTISYGIVQPGEHDEGGVPFVQTTNMSSGDFSIDSLQHASVEIESNYPRSRLHGGEVILGIRASIGAAFVVPSGIAGANLSRGVARIEPRDGLSSEYIVNYLLSNSCREYWGLSKQGSTFSEVSIATVKELPIAMPPLDEQVNINCSISKTKIRLEKLIATGIQSMKLLQERRSALISAAVTGKIDVRCWQPPEGSSATAETKQSEAV